MKNNKYYGKIQKSNFKIMEKDNIDMPNTQIHDRTLFWHFNQMCFDTGFFASFQ